MLAGLTRFASCSPGCASGSVSAHRARLSATDMPLGTSVAAALPGGSTPSRFAVGWLPTKKRKGSEALRFPILFFLVELRGVEPLTFECEPTLYQLSYSPTDLAITCEKPG